MAKIKMSIEADIDDSELIKAAIDSELYDLKTIKEETVAALKEILEDILVNDKNTTYDIRVLSSDFSGIPSNIKIEK